MKKLIIGLIAVLSFVFINRADAMVIVCQEATGVCVTPDNGDELDEGFLGTGYEASGWTETEGTPNEDVSLSGSWPSSSCSEGFESDKTGATDQYATWDRLSSITGTTDISIDWELTSHSLSGALKWLYIFAMNDTSTDIENGTFVAQIQFERDGSGNLNVYAVGSTTSGDVAVSVGTPITINLHIQSGAGNSYINVNGGSNQTFTCNTISGRYFHFGLSRDTISYTVKTRIGYIKINTP